VPRRNRVDPWGDLHAVGARGLLTGNRGCLVDDTGAVVRHHRSRLWITCRTSYRGWRWPLAEAGRWTPIFFLDDAVALAAGHRPCGLCRREDYLAYRDAVGAAGGAAVPLRSTELDRRLAAERLRRGRGLDRRSDRIVWEARVDDLPDGAVVLDRYGEAVLLMSGRLHAFGFDGWGAPRPPPPGPLTVLTPPTSAAALAHGFRPLLHPSAPTMRR
jgi:hypothetical protein